MRRKWGLVFTLAVLGGTALHFLYDVWPNPLTAVLAPVNESVWEHLKLLYWPFLAAAFVLARGADDARGRWCGLLVGLLAAILVAMIVYCIACLLLRWKELGYVIVAIAERFKRKRTA